MPFLSSMRCNAANSNITTVLMTCKDEINKRILRRVAYHPKAIVLSKMAKSTWAVKTIPSEMERISTKYQVSELGKTFLRTRERLTEKGC